MTAFQIYDTHEVARRLPFGALITALGAAFREGAVVVPDRGHHDIPELPGSLLLMPAWRPDTYVGVKIVNVRPANGDRGLPAVSSTYLLSRAVTGELVALLDGDELTRRRTVATSALAASLLARPEARVHLVIGAGAVGSMLPWAYREVLPIEHTLVNSRNLDHARELVDELVAHGFSAEVARDRRAAVAVADVVSSATLATEPLIEDAWVRPGTHVDLIGSFTPDMREVDDALVSRAVVVVDTLQALESGDLRSAIASGLVDAGGIETLESLCNGNARGRSNSTDVTLFKSVGTALEDLCAAELVVDAGAAP